LFLADFLMRRGTSFPFSTESLGDFPPDAGLFVPRCFPWAESFVTPWPTFGIELAEQKNLNFFRKK
jgi:hypothetical protein